MTTVYVTKYWMTDGILQVQAKDEPKHGQNVCVNSRGWSVYISPRDWCLTEEAARAEIAKLRAKKIASVKKQLKKLQDLDPETMPVVKK